MNSTKPITSDKPSSGWGAASIAAALLAVVAAGLALRDGYASAQRIGGVLALGQAEAMGAGAGRDEKLADAQAQLLSALAINDFDAAGWRALARVRLLQGAAPELAAPSAILMADAEAAAQRAERLQPGDPANALIRAQILHARGATSVETAALLEQAYLTPARDMTVRLARLETAVAVWSVLDRSLRAAALDDACLAARGSAYWRDRLQQWAEAASDPTLANALNGVRQRPDCAPADADLGSSPPAPASPPT